MKKDFYYLQVKDNVSDNDWCSLSKGKVSKLLKKFMYIHMGESFWGVSVSGYVPFKALSPEHAVC